MTPVTAPGHHVHFMVVAKDTLYKTSSGYYFGRAEDITFKDVFINWDEATQGGRPRRTMKLQLMAVKVKITTSLETLNRNFTILILYSFLQQTITNGL